MDDNNYKLTHREKTDITKAVKAMASELTTRSRWGEERLGTRLMDIAIGGELAKLEKNKEVVSAWKKRCRLEKQYNDSVDACKKLGISADGWTNGPKGKHGFRLSNDRYNLVYGKAMQEAREKMRRIEDILALIALASTRKEVEGLLEQAKEIVK